MKKITTIFLVLLSSYGIAQNLVSFRTAPLQSGDYSLVGNALLESYSDGSLKLRLDSSYLTASGPDVQIFLTNSANFSSPVNLTGALFIANIGTAAGAPHFSGEKEFTIPAGVNISDYDQVMLVCVQFGNLLWGYGSFDNLITHTGIKDDNSIKKSLSIFPNPFNSKLNLDLKNLTVRHTVTIQDALGKIISEQYVQNKKEVIDVSNLGKGLYFIKIEGPEINEITKIIKK
ncbi:MAG: DM13 domain-containing protein [Flavobacteriales bacterium]|nr:DM13 domain-containing protein [Flavobacteriales bacterium]